MTTLNGGWKKTLVNKCATVSIFMSCVQILALGNVVLRNFTPTSNVAMQPH
jgi:hypothetical protein